MPDEQVTVVLSLPGGPATSVRSIYSEENLEITGGLALAGASQVLGSLTVRDGSLDLQPGTDLVLWGGGNWPSPGMLNVSPGAAVHFATGDYGLSGGGVIAGTLDVAAGATVQLTGGLFTFPAGAAVTGEGTTRIFGTGAEVAGDVTAHALDLRSGSLTGTGTLTVTGALTWTGGSMGGPGATNIAAEATLSIGDFSGPSEKRLFGRTINNAGTAVWSGTGAIIGSSGSTFNNLAGATFIAESDASFAHWFAPQEDLVFNNAGTFRKTAGTGASTLSYAQFNNSGTVDLQSGTLLLQGGRGTSTGTFAVAAGAALEFSYTLHTLQAGSNVTGGGAVRLTLGGTVEVNGGYDVAVTQISGGGIGFNASATTQTVTVSAGGLSGTGTLTVTGSLTWTGGTMTGSGATDIAPGATLTIGDPSGFSYKYLFGRTINNAGSALWLGAGDIIGGSGATFNNLAGATFTAQTDAQFVQWYPPLIDFFFNNAGTFRKTAGTGASSFAYAQFNNSGVVELESGTLWLIAPSISTGAFTVAAGANLEFGFSTHTLAAGSSISGPGTVTFGTPGTVTFGIAATVEVNGSYDVGVTRITSAHVYFNTDATTNIAVLSYGTLTGAGTLTTSTIFEWSGGTMSGSGATTIAPTAVLILPDGGERYLNGRRVNSYGQVTWTGSGSIIRIKPSGGTETYVIANISSPAPAGLDACAVAADLYRTMYGGLTGWGTTEETVYRLLKGRTTDEIAEIRTVYIGHYGRNLDGDFQTEFEGDELTRVQRLMAADQADADAAGLHFALLGSHAQTFGPDRETIFGILESYAVEDLGELKESYRDRYSPENEDALKDAIRGSYLRQIEQERAIALVDGNRALADALRVGDIYSDEESHEDAFEAVLSGKTPAQIDALKQEYRNRFGPDREDALEDYIRSVMTGDHEDRALAFLEGNPAKADAIRLHHAMAGPGTLEQVVWRTLENKTSEKRAAIAQEYQRLYAVELWNDIQADFSDTSLFGPELTRTQKLLYNGGLSAGERLFFAIQGLGTDKDTIHQVLTDRTLTDIDQIRMAYQALSEGESLDDAIAGDLGGRDLFRAQQNLLGRPETLETKLSRLNAYYAFERTGGLSFIGADFLDAFNDHGSKLDDIVIAARREVLLATSPGADPIHAQQAEQLICYAMEDVKTYGEAKDTAGEIFGTVASTIAGIAVVWATAGAGTPLVISVLYAGGAGAAGQVLGHVTIAGQNYDLEQFGQDTLNGFANGATSLITFAGLPNAATPLGRVMQGAVRGYVEGTAGGFIGGVVGASLQDGVWSEGLWEGLTRVGEAGALNAVFGGLAGGALGGILAPFWHECFPAGTLVAAEGGLKPIERIEAGERVWAYNFQTVKWELRPVVEPLAYDYAGDMITIQTEEEVIEATGHHPFWVIEGEGLARRPAPQHVPAEEPGNRTTPGRWVDARDLRVGDVLLQRCGKVVRVGTLLTRADRLQVYNLHVAELHTYAVGEGGVLVHNRRPVMPHEGTHGGSWNGTRSADEANGTFTITNETVRRAAAGPDGTVPASVSVTYTNRQPNFDPFVRDIDGVRGEVRIIMDTDGTVTRVRRNQLDHAAADAAFAARLTAEGRVHPATGEAWTAKDVAEYRDRFKLTWHHHHVIDATDYSCTMQLVHRDINDQFNHTGSRSLLDVELGLSQGRRSRRR